MARNRNPFPSFLNVIIYLDREEDTSVDPRFARDFGGYEKVREAPDNLELSEEQPNGDTLTCKYIKVQDHTTTDDRSGRLRGLHYIASD